MAKVESASQTFGEAYVSRRIRYGYITKLTLSGDLRQKSGRQAFQVKISDNAPPST